MKEQINKFLESKVTVRVLHVIGVVVLIMLIFHAGVLVGFRKASFGGAWEEHYNENFGIGHRNDIRMGGMMNGLGMMDYFPNAHGAIGKIIKIELPNLIVQDKDNTEKVIVIKTDTSIQKERDIITTNDLKVDDFIVTIGMPNEQGQIEAKLIRVIPAPEFLK